MGLDAIYVNSARHHTSETANGSFSFSHMTTCADALLERRDTASEVVNVRTESQL